MPNPLLRKAFQDAIREMRGQDVPDAGTSRDVLGTDVPVVGTDVPVVDTNVRTAGTNVLQTSQVVPKQSRKRPKTSRKRAKASRTRRRKKSDSNRIRVPQDIVKYCNEIGINPKELVIWAYVNAKLNGREMRGGG